MQARRFFVAGAALCDVAFRDVVAGAAFCDVGSICLQVDLTLLGCSTA